MNSWKLNILLNIGFLSVQSFAFSQFKKKQIGVLNFKIDSINKVIKNGEFSQESAISSLLFQSYKTELTIDSLNIEVNTIENRISSEQQEKQKKEYEILKLRNEINIKRVRLDSLAIQNSIYSLNEINLINEILGVYESKQEYLVEYASEKLPQGPNMIISISKLKNKTIFTQIYQGDEGYGCTGPHTEASAEMLSIKKNGGGHYELNMKKISCHFTELGGCEDIDILEFETKNNSKFSITINLNDKNKIKFSALTTRTKCSYAWNFNGLTFSKK